MTKDITLQLEPFLTDQSKQFLEHKYESPVIMFSVGSQQQIRLCQYVGTIVNKKNNELTDADYKRFAEFINKAVENRVLQYGVYGFPMVMDLADGAIFKIYAFSDFTIFDLAVIIKHGLGYSDISSFPEGGTPTEETVKRYTENNNIYKKIFDAGVHSLKF